MSEFSDMIRNKSRQEGWSEDFQRFSDAQLDAWQPSWDAGAGRFRSEGGGGALVEKPTECPYGTTLHGSKCIPWEQANAMFGGGYGPGGGAQQPLQQAAMAWQQPQQGPVAAPVGGPWGELGGQSPQDLAAMLQPYLAQPQAPTMTAAPLQSATQGLIAPLTGMQGQAGPGVPKTLGTGWSAGQDGLTKMMARQQRRPGQYGGAAGSWWA